jgi:hypothetical protein
MGMWRHVYIHGQKLKTWGWADEMSDGEWLTASWGMACKMIGSQVFTASRCSALRESLASVVS